MVDKMSNWRQLCAELLQGLDENRHPEVRYPGHLRLVMANARAALAAEPPAPDPHEALAARPLLEAVARMGDRIGQHTVGEIAAISARAAAWLVENPPGQPVAIEPRGCPTPGACSCVEPLAPDHILDATKMVADGEREELAADLDECATSCVLAEKHNWAKHMRRAAALLRELETIAFAASDYLCAKKFPTFASDHGGLDLLEANLSRLVAHFEHGPQPVPGVDVPGPDGDYGGIQELCNAEGVDVRIGAPLLRRALAAWKQTPAPAPVPVSERPWERDGWVTDWGWCWVFVHGRWLRDYPQNYLNAACLPHWAIPQPPQGEEVAE